MQGRVCFYRLVLQLLSAVRKLLCRSCFDSQRFPNALANFSRSIDFRRPPIDLSLSSMK